MSPFTIKDILHLEVAPALGCTEPAAVALAAALATDLLPDRRVTRIAVSVDPNLYKNGVAVAIPGTQGLNGLDMAAALGAVAGDPRLRLEVLDPVDDDAVAAAKALLAKDRVTVTFMADHRGLFVKCRVTGGSHHAEAVIEGLHDRVTALSLDNTPVTTYPLLAEPTGSPTPTNRLASLETWLKKQRLADLIAMLDGLDEMDMNYIQEGIDLNMRLAAHGLKHGPGLGIGKALDRLVRQRTVRNDMIRHARILTAAAADARMAGVKLPAMTSAGSGNHGLTAVLPIWAAKDFVDTPPETVLKAVALSHTITAYIKAHTGRLSALCGCSIAAGAGASAGVAYLLGGTHHHIAGAIQNVAEDLAGVICDGAKTGCALKLATASGNAVQSALFALQGVVVLATDGIIASSAEQTMENIGTLSTQGMINTDRTILKIMLEKTMTHID